MAKQVRVWTGTQWDTLAVQLPSTDNPVFTGTTSSPLFNSTNSVGDEGGEIKFAKAATNTTLDTGVTLDVYQNRVRLFESGGTNRGGFIDMTTLGAGVATNLAPGITNINTTTFTTASAVNLNNVFSSTYQNYMINVSISAASANGNLNIRLRNGGSDRTGSDYYTANQGIKNTGTASNQTGSLTTSSQIGYTNSGAADLTQMYFSIFNPFDSARVTTFVGVRVNVDAGANFAAGSIGGYFQTANQNDGFTIFPDSGTISGTVRVYGYRNS